MSLLINISIYAAVHIWSSIYMYIHFNHSMSVSNFIEYYMLAVPLNYVQVFFIAEDRTQGLINATEVLQYGSTCPTSFRLLILRQHHFKMSILALNSLCIFSWTWGLMTLLPQPGWNYRPVSPCLAHSSYLKIEQDTQILCNSSCCLK